jgi:Carboxypeptidase regulatory-like domain
MRILIRFLIITVAPLALLIHADAQSRDASSASSSITGHVTLGGKPAPNVTVMLSPAITDTMKNMSAMFSKPVIRVTTDGEGVYRFEHVAAGRYALNTYAPAYVAPSESDSFMSQGRVVNVTEGQMLENEDFALTRGGVITGRVTDAQGRAAVAMVITLTPADGEKAMPVNDPLAGTPYSNAMYRTDDRGIYRIYGLAAGRYLVSIKSTGAAGFGAMGRQRYHEQTFHPGVTDKARAAIVEVKAGAEVSGIDIRLGLPSQTYKASGRIVDAATGKPFSAAVSYGAASGDSKTVAPRALGTTPNARGEFHLDGIVPGKYHAFAWLDDDSEFYSDATPFEVTNGDVTGITIKAHRGQVVSGTVVIEGADQETQAQLAQLRLQANNRGDDIAVPRQMAVRVAPDGTFRLAGVQPGHLNFYINSFFEPTKLAVLRTERGGMAQKEGVQVAAGESITDIRVVLAITSGVLRGEIKTTGGDLDDYDFDITATRVGGEQSFSKSIYDVDASGRFTIEGLIPGDYEVTARATAADEHDSKVTTTRERVTVMKDTETSISLTIQLPAKQGKDK